MGSGGKGLLFKYVAFRDDIGTGRSVSDVACLGDQYVVATKVWDSSLYVLRDGVIVTSIAAESDPVPAQYGLSQSYPNPFNPQTAIRYDLPQHSLVELTVFNMMGQRVANLVAGERLAGSYTVRWDGRDDRGRALASGVYLYRLQAGSFSQVKKVTLLQ